MSRHQLRALVVDDEPAARWLTSQALRKRSFDCLEASDGNEAMKLLTQQKFDLLVTDLRMPNRHGHSVVVELLSSGQERPAIIVLTGIIEPRLAEDLLLRGVDDIEFKPVDFALFAAKARAICDRRSAIAPPKTDAMPLDGSRSREEPVQESLPAISSAMLDTRLHDAPIGLSISRSAIDVGLVSVGSGISEHRVVAAIAPDCELTGKMLRLANSSYYNPDRRAVTALREAVFRMGARRFAAHAQAFAVIDGLLTKAPAWIDRELVWHRSLGSLCGMDRLCRQRGMEFQNTDLPLLSLLYPARRLAAAHLFPDHYKSLRVASEDSEVSVRELESRFLPCNTAELLGKLLVRTGVAPEVGETIEQLATASSGSAASDAWAQDASAMLRTAELIGRLAVERWELWDTYEAVPAGFLRRFDIQDPRGLVEMVRADVKRLFKTAQDDLHGSLMPVRRYFKEGTSKVLFYHPEYQNRDLFWVLLRSLGIEPVALSSGEVQDATLILSCMDAEPSTWRELLDLGNRCQQRMRVVFVVERERGGGFESLGEKLRVPQSIAAICRTLERHALTEVPNR